MRRHALRLLVALLTCACGVAATMIWLALPPLNGTSEPVQVADIMSCFSMSNAVPADASCTDPYFPAGMLADNRTVYGPFTFVSFASSLSALDEPSLLSFDDCEGEAYRFLSLGAYNEPVAIRVWRQGEQQFITVKRVAWSCSSHWDCADVRWSVNARTRLLTADEWTNFVVLLNRASYWTMPVQDQAARANYGEEWVLEGRRDCRYFLVARQSPDNLDYRAACLYLLKLASLDPPTTSLYW
ncbi:MAG: hypothetical protein ACJ74W_05985 [Pyrinomonadaceae bacterium]